MTAFAPAPSGGNRSLALAFRFALRELRGGLRGFYIFIACIALGVAAISGVASVSRALTEGISNEGQAILGTAVFAVLAGSVAAWFVITQVMNGSFTLLPGTAITAAVAALVLTVGFGLVGTWRVLGKKPAPVLRNL